MRRSAKITVIVLSVALVIFIALILVFTLKPKKPKKPTESEALKNTSSEVRDFIKEGFNGLIKLMSSIPVPIPDLYSGCSGSTINRIKFCGNLKYSGTIDVGGSVACSIPYNACRAGCQAACIPCHFIPFVSCKVPCTDCPNACKRVYDACSGGTKAEWSVNVLEAFDIGNTMTISDFESFSLDQNTTGGYDVTMKLVVATSPSANIDVRTTASLGNYKGNVKLGNLKVTIPVQLQYNCRSRQTTLKKFDKLQVQGVDVQFNLPEIADVIRRAIFSVAKSKIDDTLKSTLEDKLTSLFSDFIRTELLPKLQLGIPC